MQRFIQRVALVACMTLAATVLVTGPAAAPAGAAPADNPIGHLDAVRVLADSVVLSGWAADPSSSASVDLHFYYGGNFLGVGRADNRRTDVAAVVPWAGRDRGFDETFALPPGEHLVCAYAINIGPGEVNSQLGCLKASVDVPFGNLEAVTRSPQGIRLQGWAIDPDALTSPTTLYAEVGWGSPATVLANGARADMGVYPGAGPNHGFDVSVPAPVRDGAVRVCVYGLRPQGPVSLIGCGDLEMRVTPWGSLDAVRSGTDNIRVTGWALDPDMAAPIEVHVYTEDGSIYPGLANGSRPDVAALYPGYGDAHGFTVDIPASHIGQTVCVFAINVGPGPVNPNLGCLTPGRLAPAGSGGGRRIIYDNLGQHVWLMAADGYADRDYAVSGRYRDPGLYFVYGFIRYASAGHDGITMDYFVAFHPEGLGYGFHTIPVFADGTPLQDESELGSFRSAGCVRQALGDAVYLWNWAQVGDPVVVI